MDRDTAIRAICTAFALGVVVGVAVALTVGPPPRVVRFYSVPPEPLDACDLVPARAPAGRDVH